MNNFKGVEDHQVTLYKLGAGRHQFTSNKVQRPKGMSGRQWNKLRKSLNRGEKVINLQKSS